jgi:peptidoglycan/LPS O-acetylase OafA/YrhL
MKASSLSFKLAVLFVVAGMAMGIGMAASHDHSIMPAHAHLNLLGWVSLFLFGIYYKLHPSLERSRLALAQIVVWSLGTVVLTIGVAAIHLGYDAAEPVTAAASFIVLGAILLFGYLVFRPASSVLAEPMVRMTPAE